MKRESLVLVDAYSQIFRSFYAIRMLTNARGEPVNAAFIFMKLLLQLEKQHPSKYGAMLFDCGKVAFRLKLNPAYKANRPPMPDELRTQIPLIRNIAGAFGWPLLQHEGLEADDLIGGLSQKHINLKVEIVSSDKDLSQLIDDRVSMLVPTSGGFEHRGVDEVKSKFGVTPENMVDYLALIGDSSDNIPGVPGIGPKSASEIIHSFGKAELWLDHPEKLPADHKFTKKLLPELETVKRNRELIRLNTQLPDELNVWNAPERKTPDWETIREICVENSFKSILKELPEPLPVVSKASGEPDDDLFSFTAAVQQKKNADLEEKEIQGELF